MSLGPLISGRIPEDGADCPDGPGGPDGADGALRWDCGAMGGVRVSNGGGGPANEGRGVCGSRAVCCCVADRPIEARDCACCA